MNQLKDTIYNHYSNALLELSLNVIDIKFSQTGPNPPDIEATLARTEVARIALFEAIYQLDPENKDITFEEVVKKHLIATGFILESEYSEYESKLIAETVHYMQEARRSILQLITKNTTGKDTRP